MKTAATARPRLQPEEVRKSILAATRQIYLAKGYAGTSTDEIAALSAVSKQTIYRHFTDKDDLIASAIQNIIDETELRGAPQFEALAESDDLPRDLRIFARQHIRDVVQPEILQLRRRILAEVDRFPQLALAWYQAGPQRGHQKIAATLDRLRERGWLDVEDTALAAQHLNWLILSIPLNLAMFTAGKLSDADRFDYFADQAVRVFLAAYGREDLAAQARATKSGL